MSIMPVEVSKLLSLLQRAVIALERIADALGQPAAPPTPISMPPASRAHGAPPVGT